MRAKTSGRARPFFEIGRSTNALPIKNTEATVTNTIVFAKRLGPYMGRHRICCLTPLAGRPLFWRATICPQISSAALLDFACPSFPWHLPVVRAQTESLQRMPAFADRTPASEHHAQGSQRAVHVASRKHVRTDAALPPRSAVSPNCMMLREVRTVAQCFHHRADSPAKSDLSLIFKLPKINRKMLSRT